MSYSTPTPVVDVVLQRLVTARGGEYFTEALADVLEEAYHGCGDVITNMDRLVQLLCFRMRLTCYLLYSIRYIR